MDDFWAVVPAGGAGTRLWPLSRSGKPKFLLDLTGSGRTLIQATIDRLTPLAHDRVLVVTGVAHRDAVLAQLPSVAPDQVLAEPAPRDSMAAIGLAAALLERRAPAAVMGSFAADHVIGDGGAFRHVIRRAAEVARDGWLATVGIAPATAATGYGYIQVGEEIAEHPHAHTAVSFVEKPSPELAADYVETGDYRWNAGMFVTRPRVLLDLLAESDPAFAAELRAIAAEPDRLHQRWGRLPRISVDHAVAEPAARTGRVAVVPGEFAWRDIGDFAALAESSPAAPLRIVGDSALVRSIDASGVVVPDGSRTIAVVGLADVIVVETADALLVTTLDRAQDVKQVVADLTEAGRDDLV